MRHRFGWSGEHGVDRCACGTERELHVTLNPPHVPFWWYRKTAANGDFREGRLEWPCGVAKP